MIPVISQYFRRSWIDQLDHRADCISDRLKGRHSLVHRKDAEEVVGQYPLVAGEHFEAAVHERCVVDIQNHTDLTAALRAESERINAVPSAGSGYIPVVDTDGYRIR